MDLSERAATLEREERVFTGELEVRTDGDGLTFDGVASVVDHPYSVRDMLGEYEETITRGAFNKTIKERDDVRLLVNHEGIPLARTASKTLRLTAEPDLRAVTSLDGDSPLVRTLTSAMNRGDMNQMSIGFQAKRGEWNEDYTVRTIREVKLFDVSLVTFPASPTTTAALRSLDQAVRALIGDEVNDEEIARTIAYLEGLRPPAPAPDAAAEVREEPCTIHPDLVAAVYAAAKARPLVLL